MVDTLRLKRVLGRCFGRVMISGDLHRCVLLYHSVGNSKYGVSEADFSEQMSCLAEAAEVVSLCELIGGRDKGGNLGRLRCSITFDDGYSSVYSTAWPIMRNFGFTASVFVTTGAVHSTQPQVSSKTSGLYPDETILTWQQIDELSQNGFEVGSHLQTHTDLVSLSEDQMRKELLASREEIEERVGMPCRSVAYPWGSYNTLVRQCAAASGYSVGLSGIHGFILPNVDMFSIPRIDIRREFCLADFRDILSGRWNYLGAIQQLRRATRML